MSDLLLSYFRWPRVVLVLGLILLVTQKDAFTRLVDRVRRAWLLHFSAAPPALQAQAKPEPLESQPAVAALLALDSPLLKEVEAAMRSDPKYVAIDSVEHRERVLLRLFAVTRIALFFEQTQNAIYGSQTGALRFLATQVVPVAMDPGMKYFYDQAAAAFPTHPTFDRWFAFLLQMELVVSHADGVQITPRGREFLKYLIDMSY